jgi:long-chain acyl-CoA synthetase
MPANFHPDQLATLYGLFQARVAATPDSVAYRQFDAATESWQGYRWSQIASEVARWQAAFASEGLQPGDRVALMLKNCIEWVIFDQAALSLGLVTVPLYLDDRAENAAFILNHSGAKLLLIEGRFQHKKIAEMGTTIAGLQRIVCLARPDADLSDMRVVVAADWLAAAEATQPALPQLDADQLASIIYTSGTTGRPKGVMLSHANMLWNAWYATHCIALGEDDVYLSFLPLSHTLERTAGYYWPMLVGAEVAYARSVTQLAQDLLTIRPTMLLSVPRIYERVYARIQDGLAQKSPLASELFRLTLQVGWRRFEHRYRRATWSAELLLWPLLNALVARKISAKFGGRLVAAISGGAALSPEIARTFISLDVPIYQGYGLTETSPVVCVNRPSSNKPDSIGQPMTGIEIKIGDRDELFTRSRCVMLGYWQNAEATRTVIDADGWLHTGDKASIDADGHCRITGRIKDIIVLSNGEKVPPTDMEAALQLDPLFDQVMIVGEGRVSLAALLVLNADHWPGFAHGLGLDPGAPDSLHDVRVVKALLKRCASLLKTFPGYAQVRRIYPTLAQWTVDAGLLTPTLKIKRSQVQNMYREEIDAMYANLIR